MENTNTQQQDRFEGNYIDWIKSELADWPPVIWGIFWFGIGFELSMYLLNPITLLSSITMAATFFGILCCCAMCMGKPLNGLLGAISAIGYIYVNWNAGHYASVLDQIIFLAAIDIPLMLTWRHWGQDFDGKVRKIGKKGWLILAPAILALWAVLLPIYTKLGDSRPIPDSLVLALGATASLLVLIHFADSYSVWLMEDVVNVGLWIWALQDGFTQAALPMLVVTIIYSATAVFGKLGSPWSNKHLKEIGVIESK